MYGAQAPATQMPQQLHVAHTHSPQPQGAPFSLANRTRSAEEEEELQKIQEREQDRQRMQQAQAEARGGAAPMKIKENYVPRAAQRAANKFGAQTAICPNCKQQIPLNEMEEHMRSKPSHHCGRHSFANANVSQLSSWTRGGRNRKPRRMRDMRRPTSPPSTSPTISSVSQANGATSSMALRGSPFPRRSKLAERRLL